MKIKTRTYILFAVFMTALILLSGVVYFTSQQITQATLANGDVNSIRDEMSKLRMLTFDYLLQKPERAKQQWQTESESLGKLLAPEEHAKHKHSGEGLAMLEKMRTDNQDLGKIFSQLTQSGISQELETQLSSQLLLKSQDMISLASQLSGLTNQKIIDSQTRANYLNAVFIILLLTVALLTVYLIIATILRPLTKLHQGTEKIEQGDLDYKIGTKTKDELGQLSRSFDAMTESFKKSQAKISTFANRAREVINHIVPVLQKVSTGDLSKNVEISEKEDEFSELLVSVNLTVDDLKESQKITKEQQKALLNVLKDVNKEKELSEREKDKIQAILSSIGDAVFVVDKNLKIIMFNKVAEKVTGYKTSEAIDKDYHQILKFVFEKDEKTNDRFVHEAIESGEIKEMGNHTILITKEGKKIPVADSASPLKDPAGNILGCVVVFRDITKEREFMKMKDEFLNIAAHDLRTPMTAIKGYNDMMINGDFGEISDKLKAPLEETRTASERLIRLVNDFLSSSRIESGKISVQPKLVDIIPIIQSIINQVSPIAKKKGLELSVDKLPNQLFVYTDLDKIQQVIINLLDNAIKYTRTGSVKMSIKTEEKSAVFSIIDTGVGISEESQENLFSKYYQVSGGTKKVIEGQGSGLGLGLYVSRLIVEGCGGKIWVESKIGKGSKFSFSLPLKKG